MHRIRAAATVPELEGALQRTVADRDRIARELEAQRQSTGLLKQAISQLLSEPCLLDRFRSSCQALPSLSMAGCDAADSATSARHGLGLYVPNVYGVGFPKCGTSLIFSILRQHPQIFLGEKDGDIPRLNDGPSEEADCVRSADLTKFLREANYGYEGQPILATFRVYFCLDTSGAQFIKARLHSSPRIIICLRQPVDRALSHFRMRTRQFGVGLLDSLNSRGFMEPEDFNTALGSGAERKLLNPDIYRSYYSYIEASSYFEYVRPYFDLFGPENVKVLVLEEDIMKNLHKTIMEVFAFLGINDAEAIRIAFADHGRFVELSRSPKHIETSFETATGDMFSGASLTAETLLHSDVKQIHINSDVPYQLELAIDRPTLSEVMAAATLKQRHDVQLTSAEERSLYNTYFRDDVHRLEQLIGRDLSVWYSRYDT
jgi:hypothetical protein